MRAAVNEGHSALAHCGPTSQRVRLMKKVFGVLAGCVFLLASTAVCFAAQPAPQPGAQPEGITTLAQLASAKVAVPKGTLADTFVKSKFPKAAIMYFPNAKACVEALREGGADAVAYDEPVLRSLKGGDKSLRILSEFIRRDEYAIAINPKRPELKRLIDEQIVKLKKNGHLGSMADRWIGSSMQSVMPHIMVPHSRRPLVFGTFAPVEPFTFKNGKKLMGYDIELAQLLARAAKSSLVMREMPFEQLIPSVAAGKLDAAAACITITPERAKQVLFSEPYYTGGLAVMVKK